MGSYTTKQGDTWDSIAFAQMGSCDYTKTIMWANQQYLDYYTFPAGIVLSLPEQNMKIDSSMPPWKQVNG